MARTSLKSLLADLIEQAKDSPVPIRSIELDPTTKRVKVEFGGPAQAAATSASPPPEPKYVPGTQIPDDDSSVNWMDTVLTPATYEVEN